MTDAACQPFKPDTWPVDADGFVADLCTECGTPVRYGSRHSDCGRKAMGLPTIAEERLAMQSAPGLSRSQRMAAAGFTARDRRLTCDECGARFTQQMAPLHDCPT